ncbi:RsmB/NOP family class I SAM-dependent RNA methyltransferase [Pelobium manganitolerans]|uniref:RsmB/NOP family class I SAM-dependent RNA methyltransferase n=1 Tax=Pelobium manganitolerans TaxID=1842495 RepID=UPI003FA3D4A4
MKAIHQLATLQKILGEYQFEQPLHRFLAQYYRQNKQMGGRDRRTASSLTYNYFRLGGILAKHDLETRIAVAELLCNTETSEFVAYYRPNWQNKLGDSLTQKLSFLKSEFADFQLSDVFPEASKLSPLVNMTAFYESFFVQPNLYIRALPHKAHVVAKKLSASGIAFEKIGEHAFSMANGTKLEAVLDKGDYEVQDISSQKVGAFFEPKPYEKWWDCCAASGGKSLLLHSQEPSVKLLVSDNRESILHNLRERFFYAGIEGYQQKVLDLTQNQDLLLSNYEFDGIILDAPCSGSGTWGRTPEMLSAFPPEKVDFYSNLQRKIASNVVSYLKPGKPLIYITCSVFEPENEAQVKWLCDTFQLKTERMELISGYKDKADTLFVARLVKQG